MSGLAAILAGHEPPGIHPWHGAFDVADVRHSVEHAGWGFGWVDGWTTADSKAGFLAAVGEALDFPDHYGQNFDALADCLNDIGAGQVGLAPSEHLSPTLRSRIDFNPAYPCIAWAGWINCPPNDKHRQGHHCPVSRCIDASTLSLEYSWDDALANIRRVPPKTAISKTVVKPA